MPDPKPYRFTLIHLVALVAIVLLLFVFFLGLQRRTHEVSNRLMCSSNLRQLGVAMKLYANDEPDHAFPRTRYDMATADHPTAHTGVDAFLVDGPAANDVTAAIYLILRTQEITPDVFVCPASATAERLTLPPGKTVQSFRNFPSQANLGYSFQNPYPTRAGVDAGFVWNDKMSADTAIAADINPGVPELMTVQFDSPGALQRAANSPNHQYDGQNVLYADCHVEWSASVWAGADQDHIYTFSKPRPTVTTATATTQPLHRGEPAGIIGPPADAADSVLLPAWDQKISLPGR